ncbi:hypothetical protein FHX42_005300 [Saccharopolyspora lacisalsi]|uniref:Uncharacterized protein n=1 Tax=Halosaccharopolyspora lacisalsi TaxID=1000566 RepID=A0A839E3N1_9PSEU|nr:hypothetical protein [Halosaccharopolyspora lacisalsi]MBA8827893.1 hypothetical protein [Halosaccharopolyspora lacisalsi]
MYTIPTTTLRKTPGAWGAFTRHVIHYGYHLAVTRSLSHITDDPSPQVAAIGVSFTWWVGNLSTDDPPENGVVRSRHDDLVEVVTKRTNEARPGLPTVLDDAVYRDRHTTVYRYRERATVFMPPTAYEAWTGNPIQLGPEADFVHELEQH